MCTCIMCVVNNCFSAYSPANLMNDKNAMQMVNVIPNWMVLPMGEIEIFFTWFCIKAIHSKYSFKLEQQIVGQ